MQVRYNPALPIVFLVLGVSNTMLGLLMLRTGGSAWTSLLVGPLFTVIGLLQLTRTYFEFDPATRTIALKSLVGPVVRRFGGAVGGALHVDGNRILWTRPDGQVRKVPVSRYLARGDQWRAVIGQVA
ncbi:hypothetical protein [Actinophytocola sp. NPDC049390]|uniref:hypothetical protein n=1 Tax=Actinophytocola sp. NPDC049390 TaxID=3363894 RepID=UPI00379731E3